MKYNNINNVIMSKIAHISSLKLEIIDYTKSMLAETGEQGFLCQGMSVITMDSMDENGNEVEFNIDMVKVDEKGRILVHDIYLEKWCNATYFGCRDLIYLAQHINWYDK